ILVSTDDHEIAKIARGEGALVPWLRPAELATDRASSVDVALHAIDWYESHKGKVDGLLLLQPTSPFRSRSTVEQGMRLFCDYKYRPVVGVSPAKSHPMQCFKIDGEMMRPMLDGGDGLRSQDLPLALRRGRSFYPENMMPLVIELPEESIDIDTEWDWKMAEAIAEINRMEAER
ncbi:MAG: acylneuraminate cytidylyltransferase family protein, partial [Deltaproteobacteria bacterium]|nr:acylneuraminate cytidylyltransferase family protein [Deltaproteobacteria bacterium]